MANKPIFLLNIRHFLPERLCLKVIWYLAQTCISTCVVVPLLKDVLTRNLTDRIRKFWADFYGLKAIYILKWFLKRYVLEHKLVKHSKVRYLSDSMILPLKVSLVNI